RTGALARGLAGGLQLAAGPPGEPLHTHRLKHVAGAAQLGARVAAPALPAQPLPVKQMRTGQIRAQPGAAQPLDRLPEQLLRDWPFSDLRPTPSLHTACPIGAA